MLPFFSHALISSCFTFICPSSLLRLTWLTDPALVTSVYPNRMQYTPRVLQEVSLWDGVDAGVHGNGRRFSKTSSYPPCRCYAFTSFHLYFLTTSSSPLSLLIHSFHTTHYTLLYLINHSHAPYHLCFPIVSLYLTRFGNTFYFQAEQCS